MQTHTSTPQPTHAFNQRAFLVEDSQLIRDNLISTLDELADVQVVAYADRESTAVQWLRRHADTVDFVILEMFLTEGSGLGVLRELNHAGIHADVYVLTNHATPDMRQRCKELGIAGFFDKACDAEDFLDVIRARRHGAAHAVH